MPILVVYKKKRKHKPQEEPEVDDSGDEGDDYTYGESHVMDTYDA